MEPPNKEGNEKLFCLERTQCGFSEKCFRFSFFFIAGDERQEDQEKTRV